MHACRPLSEAGSRVAQYRIGFILIMAHMPRLFAYTLATLVPKRYCRFLLPDQGCIGS